MQPCLVQLANERARHALAALSLILERADEFKEGRRIAQDLRCVSAFVTRKRSSSVHRSRLYREPSRRPGFHTVGVRGRTDRYVDSVQIGAAT